MTSDTKPWSVEPPSDAQDDYGISLRVNWLAAQVDGLNAQLAARRSDTTAAGLNWRGRAIAALHYRLDELRHQKLRRRHLSTSTPVAESIATVNIRRERVLLGRVLPLFDDVEDLTAYESDLLEDIRECLG